MIVIVLLGLLACANAAPKRGSHHHHHHHHCHRHSHYEDDSNTDKYSNPNIESQILQSQFDTQRLWSDLSTQMMRLNAKLTDLSKRFNRNEASPQIDDKEYTIFLQLQGFSAKEILVKENNGLLFVQATRKVVGERDRVYFNTMTLPNNVGEQRNWTYENGLLKIVFPITQVKKEIVTQTTASDKSMEWGGNEEDNDQNEKKFKTNFDMV